ncbi:uncharacterized protein LOC103698892 isoform X2 [Phoenix dactylifera]|uniref:Uncharacterized protein LOC103698892 isoform X2 n=1 Tax=Phoenix dactylifera TaxID=42345 RepID=A0A8B8ZY17_PHODC|nr:uncharacterized protein LOC103698892 isoform X2 [Phoenix dactylifera]
MVGAIDSNMIFLDLLNRRTLIYAVDQDAEKSFKTTVEVDRLIDMLRDSSSGELEKLVVENVLAFNENFWIRLAARTDTCKSDDDKKDYEELAVTLMSIVDRLVHKTNEKIESATDVLKGILNPVMDEVEEISWPPKDPKSLILMENELVKREQEGQLDEGFLSEVNAQLRQVRMPQRRAKKTTIGATNETPNRHADSTPQRATSIPQQEGVMSPQTGQEPGLSQVM